MYILIGKKLNMTKNKKNNEYSNRLKHHPIFKENKIRSDFEMTRLFQNTFQIYKSIIEGELCDELECYEEDDVCEESGNNTTKVRNNNKSSQEEDATDHEEDLFEENNTKEEMIDDEDESECDLAIEYSVLLLTTRLYKIFEHMLLRKYLYEVDKENRFDLDTIDFEEIIVFCKKNKIIISEEEENGIYLLQLLVNETEEQFLFQPNDTLESSLLTNDKYMLCDVDHAILYKTIVNLNDIVERI